jgi:hypothetical protein
MPLCCAQVLDIVLRCRWASLFFSQRWAFASFGQVDISWLACRHTVCLIQRPCSTHSVSGVFVTGSSLPLCLLWGVDLCGFITNSNIVLMPQWVGSLGTVQYIMVFDDGVPFPFLALSSEPATELVLAPVSIACTGSSEMTGRVQPQCHVRTEPVLPPQPCLLMPPTSLHH